MNARPEQEQVKERVRDASDVVDVVEQCVPLRKAGSSFKACCPFHEEKTPSFNVNPSKQIWHCFGCGAGGDVFAFVMQYQGVTFPEALRYLAQRAGIALPEYDGRKDGEIGRTEIYDVNVAYASFFEDVLLRRAEGRVAREYLQGRGIHADVAKAFGLGFALDGWTTACAAPELRGVADAHKQAAGLARPRQDGSLYDLFRNRVIFPIHGAGGDIVAFGGRTLGDDDAKYINSPETVAYRKGSQLYNLHRARRAIQQAGRVILVEGYFDAIRLSIEGFEETAATCGTALTPQQAKLLGRHTQLVVVVYDGDDAGRAAAEKAAGLLLEAGLDVKLVIVPGGADPDDFLREQGADAFRALLDRAGDVVDFVYHYEVQGRSGLTVDQNMAYIDRLTALSARIPNPARKAMYRKQIAAKFQLVASELPHPVGARPEAAHTADGDPPAAPLVQLREREREPLRLLLQHLGNAGYMSGSLEALRDAVADYPAVVRHLVYRILDSRGEIMSFADLLDQTQDAAERQVLLALEVVAQDEQCYSPEWLLHHLNLRRAKHRLGLVGQEMRQAQAAGDAARLRELADEVPTMTALKESSRSALHSLEVEHELV